MGLTPCDICADRHRLSGNFRNHYLCPECFQEYLAIFEGLVPRSFSKKTKVFDEPEDRD